LFIETPSIKPTNFDQENRPVSNITRSFPKNKKPQSDARYSSIPLRLLIRLSLRAAHDFQSLSVIFKHLPETGRILAQRLKGVKKKATEESAVFVVPWAANRH